MGQVYISTFTLGREHEEFFFHRIGENGWYRFAYLDAPYSAFWKTHSYHRKDGPSFIENKGDERYIIFDEVKGHFWEYTITAAGDLKVRDFNNKITTR